MKIFPYICATIMIPLLTGCVSSGQLAKNLEAKSIIGEGFVSLSRISVTNPETGFPEIKTLIVSGKMQTILKDANLLSYSRNHSASVFNASCTTESEQLTISLPPGKNMADVVRQLSALTAEKKSVSVE